MKKILTLLLVTIFVVGLAAVWVLTAYQAIPFSKCYDVSVIFDPCNPIEVAE